MKDGLIILVTTKCCDLSCVILLQRLIDSFIDSSIRYYLPRLLLPLKVFFGKRQRLIDPYIDVADAQRIDSFDTLVHSPFGKFFVVSSSSWSSSSSFCILLSPNPMWLHAVCSVVDWQSSRRLMGEENVIQQPKRFHSSRPSWTRVSDPIIMLHCIFSRSERVCCSTQVWKNTARCSFPRWNIIIALLLRTSRRPAVVSLGWRC